MNEKEIREQILYLIENYNIKSLPKLLKNRKEILDYLINYYNENVFVTENVKITEIVYYFLNKENPICQNGNKKIFKNFYMGYGFCRENNSYCFCRKENQKNKLKKFYENLSEDKKEEMKIKAKETNLKKYGVESPMKNEEIKNKLKETNLKKYGVEHSTKNEKIRKKISKQLSKKYSSEKYKNLFRKLAKENSNKRMEKYKNTCFMKYGVDNIFKSEIYKEKIRKKLLEKYDVDHPLKSKEIKEKMKINLMKKYGVDNPMKNEEIKNKLKETILKKYGVEWILQNKEIKKLIKETNLKKYGVDNPSKNKEIKERIKEGIKKTFIEKYGVSHPTKLSQIKQKIKETNLKKYGVEYVSQNEEIKERIKQIFIKKYGFDNPAKNNEIKERIKEGIKKTFIEKYGIPYPAKLSHIKQKIKETNLKKYGVESVSQRHLSKETIEKMNDPIWLRYQHHELKKSGIEIGKEIGVSESVICKKLNKFGIPILTHSRSMHEKEIERFLIEMGYELEIINRKIIYPYELDIFIPQKNIAIEYCGLYWHREDKLGKDYHVNKLNLCLEKGIKLITLFSNEWIYDNEKTKQKILWVLNGEEYRLYERDIGNEEILVDRRWTEGKFFLDMGYELIEILEPKKWAFDGKENLYETWEEKNEIDFIWDCGINRYRKNLT